MYKVIAYFVDLKDNNHEYRVGDTFPRKGLKVDDARLAELSGKENKRGIPLIQKVEETATAAPAVDPADDSDESKGKKPAAKNKPAGK